MSVSNCDLEFVVNNYNLLNYRNYYYNLLIYRKYNNIQFLKGLQIIKKKYTTIVMQFNNQKIFSLNKKFNYKIFNY